MNFWRKNWGGEVVYYQLPDLDALWICCSVPWMYKNPEAVWCHGHICACHTHSKVPKNRFHSSFHSLKFTPKIQFYSDFQISFTIMLPDSCFLISNIKLDFSIFLVFLKFKILNEHCCSNQQGKLCLRNNNQLNWVWYWIEESNYRGV